MKQIDKLVGHLVRFAAEALEVASNGPVVVRTTAGERASNQLLDHAAVTSMVQEVCPPARWRELAAGQVVRFVYEGAAAGVVTVEVTPSAGKYTVLLVPGATAGLDRVGAAPAAPETAAAPARTSNAPAAATVAATAATAPARPAQGPTRPAQGTAPAASSPEARDIEQMLRTLSQRGGSDLHLSTGAPPLMRLHGEMVRYDETTAPFTSDGLKALLWPIVPTRSRDDFTRRRDADFAHEVPGVSRFRANLFVDRNGVGAVFRRIPYEVIPAEKLGLSAEVVALCSLPRGLVLVTGPTGSGKSTTLASLIDRINSTRDDHILTIEDPIEFVHPDKRCLVNQREVHVHTQGFRHALRAALREDPDVVLVGEMRDLETVEIAIETAETGHLVFGTLHTNTAPSTVDRLIDQFPSDRQGQIRAMLAESLKGVIAQTLCKKIGGGRVAAYEVLLGTPAVANLIREGKTYQLYGTIQSSRGIGMCSLGESLTDLVQRGLVDPREAYMKAVNKSEIRQLFANAGIALPEA
jgi:twitching motility protein PilT